MNLDIKLPRLVDNPKDKFKKLVIGATYAATVAYANAAAAAVPIWTGYTRAIWLGVARKSSQMAYRYGVTPPAITIDMSGAHPWFAPPMPVTRPSQTILDSTSAQKAKGISDAKDVLTVQSITGGVQITIEIPEYDGEENYAIQEEQATPRGVGPWNSMVVGRIAFARALKVVSRQIKLKGLIING